MDFTGQLRLAYQRIAKTYDGQLILADILLRCDHFKVATDPERRVLQQFATETLRTAGLYDGRESFPRDYIALLAETKLPSPGFFVRVWWRLFGRKN